MFTRIRRIIRIANYQWHGAYFRRKCTKAGENLSVQGPVIVYGGGSLHVGSYVIIRSRPHLPVDIYVAPHANLEIGDHVFINQGVRLSCSQSIAIGDGCILGDETLILDSDFHAPDGVNAKKAPVVIESNVWLAARVTLLRGVTVGQGSVIGAGAVVTHSIPPNTFAAGVPAIPLRSLRE